METKLQELAGAIIEDGPTPHITDSDIADVLRGVLTVALRADTRSKMLERVVAKVATAANKSLNVADRLESFARSPHRWTLESFRDDLDAMADDLRGAWRLLDGVVGGATVEQMDEAIHDPDRQSAIAHEVATRFGTDPDGPDRRASLGIEAVV